MTKNKHGISLLTDQQVCEIRNNPHGLTQQKLAEKFGVSQVAISHVKTYRSYKDVTCN